MKFGIIFRQKRIYPLESMHLLQFDFLMHKQLKQKFMKNGCYHHVFLTIFDIKPSEKLTVLQNVSAYSHTFIFFFTLTEQVPDKTNSYHTHERSS